MTAGPVRPNGPRPLCDVPGCEQLAAGMVAVEFHPGDWRGRFMCRPHLERDRAEFVARFGPPAGG